MSGVRERASEQARNDTSAAASFVFFSRLSMRRGIGGA